MRLGILALTSLLLMTSLAIPAQAATNDTCAVQFDFGNGQVYWSDISVTPGMSALDVTRLAAAENGFTMTDSWGFVSTINGLGWNATTGEYWNFWTWNSTHSVWDWSMVGADAVNASKAGAIAWSYAASSNPMTYAPPYQPLATPDHRDPGQPSGMTPLTQAASRFTLPTT